MVIASSSTHRTIRIGTQTSSTTATSYLPAMRLMAANMSRLPFNRIVTQRMPLERAQEGVELAQTDAAMKIVMAPNGTTYA